MKNVISSKVRTKENKQYSLYKKTFIGFITTALLMTFFIFSTQAFAGNQDPAEQEKARIFIEEFSQKAINILNNKELSEDELYAEYRTILTEDFALDYIARISLSRHRKKASKQELSEYYKLFPEFILKVNSSRLRKLDTKKIVIDKVTPHAKADIFIRTKAYNSNDKPLDVDWRVRSDKNGVLKIIDVKIEGISMVATQRDDFTARISSSGIAGLNRYMKDIIDGTEIADNNDLNDTKS